MSAPSLLALPFEDWVLSGPLIAMSVIVAVLYVVMAQRARNWPRARTVSFLLGVATVQIALQSGLDSYDDRLLSAHMIQHLLLIESAPALLLCGRPVHLALKVLPAKERRVLGRALVRARGRFTPATCLILFSVIVLGVHIPVFFNATVHNQTLHEAEHFAFLCAGMLVWWPLLGDPEPRRRLGTIGQLIYLTLAALPMALIGAYLNRDQTLFYSAYRMPTSALGVSPILDQQRGGAIMLVAGTVVMSVVGLLVLLNAMLAAERRQRARELHEVAG